MPSITFDLETVTPLFLAGANQQEAELRPPAFRGALRYWFRAIVGLYYWNNLAGLKDIESNILGDTTDTHGGSKISLRLSHVSPSLSTQSVSINDRPGLKYLWFSMEMTQRIAIGVDEPGQFSLTLNTRPNPSHSEQQQRNLVIAANCFWLAVNLGGFGSRERRGAGSLKVRKVKHQGLDENLVKNLPKFEIRVRPDDIIKYFQNEIKKVQRNCKELLNLGEAPIIPRTELPDIEIYKPDVYTIYRIKTPYSSWENALNYVGEQYSSYRQDQSLKDRRVFGLPLTRIDTDSRRPSPLRIKMVRSVNDYYCFLSRTYADFPEKAGISDRSQFQIIDDFIKGLPNIEKVV